MPTPDARSKWSQALADMVLVPRASTAAAAERFLRQLAMEIALRPSPEIGWSDFTGGDTTNLWARYREMSEPLRAALREGWTTFVVRVPQGAHAAAMKVNDLLAEPEAAEWFTKFMTVAPWLDPETAELDGSAYAEILSRRRRERRQRWLARRRHGGRRPRPSQRASATASPPLATPPRGAVTTRPSAAMMALPELRKWLADLGETRQDGEPVTVNAVRGRLRHPERHSSEYADLVAIRDRKSGRFPRLQALEILNRCARRLGAERNEMTALAAATREAKRLQAEGLQQPRPR